ncbi:hypothetical protein BDY21DRAFT_329867 [Lineolata rhizophorae]|uniref:Secreted protein n=1 Tax=Lineolata rhizophorae TaxID=578093 RepID=A0A6A6PD16_9PEZI|nr:hypothetical protein BDY21DRAFT_329867 [Lineolata rhizophorae]
MFLCVGSWLLALGCGVGRRAGIRAVLALFLSSSSCAALCLNSQPPRLLPCMCYLRWRMMQRQGASKQDIKRHASSAFSHAPLPTPLRNPFHHPPLPYVSPTNYPPTHSCTLNLDSLHFTPLRACHPLTHLPFPP